MSKLIHHTKKRLSIKGTLKDIKSLLKDKSLDLLEIRIDVFCPTDQYDEYSNIVASYFEKEVSGVKKIQEKV